MNIFRVSFAGRELYRLFDSHTEMNARLSGAFRHAAAGVPVVGDYVEVRNELIRAVLPRRTQFSRRAAGRRPDEQVIAANIDVVFIVTGLDGDYNPRRIERYLVLARESGAEAVVVLNKCDLWQGPLPCPAPDVPVIGTSTVIAGGLDPLLPWLAPGRTVALLGSSGAGKSSILNRLLCAELQRTSDVRQHDSRGRHTTTHRELFALPSGVFVIDTPGMRELQLWAEQDSVENTFAEIEDIAAGCRFSDCRHSGEPGCAVAAALGSGELDGDRWASYRKLTAEVQQFDKKKLKKMEKDMRQHKRYHVKW